jgi:ADP-heptose:LPS heptosyltransferase
VADPAHTHLLVIRFSALGDIAMTVPVIRQVLDQHPALQITFVSEKKMAPLFHGIPRLEFAGYDIRHEYKGVGGLYRLFRQLSSGKKINAVADLHNVLRTKILGYLFRVSGLQVEQIDKGRAGKKALTSRTNKIIRQQKTTVQRYADVFDKLGFPVTLPGFQERRKLPVVPAVEQILSKSPGIKIGLAPFAKHREKMYPLEEMEKVVHKLTQKGYSVFLLGGGKEEASKLKKWENLYPGAINSAGLFSFAEELVLISQLHLVISMDSANMHLASLFGVPVISIWGATHPFAGFLGFGQQEENIIHADLSCRPCSVFGNKKCYRGDWACMTMINPRVIIEKSESVIRRIQV